MFIFYEDDMMSYSQLGGGCMEITSTFLFNYVLFYLTSIHFLNFTLALPASITSIVSYSSNRHLPPFTPGNSLIKARASH
jgi:hypothetical protein